MTALNFSENRTEKDLMADPLERLGLQRAEMLDYLLKHFLLWLHLGSKQLVCYPTTTIRMGLITSRKQILSPLPLESIQVPNFRWDALLLRPLKFARLNHTSGSRKVQN